ncbi:hypothetical protein [Desulfoluna spongiiphila]|uniref:Uncharacterized protein n=1 Tax=Desulfoluna spongiiphila TaxID=419481 RepID=A0A1G5G1F5_9BACT|nr:hypothetical protein [Desulfoluna spongiiphila]SCY45366.1 hypothetical protein SAMN05216233_109145 [Desulfoluna spongiiphila]
MDSTNEEPRTVSRMVFERMHSDLSSSLACIDYLASLLSSDKPPEDVDIIVSIMKELMMYAQDRMDVYRTHAIH